ncbi:ATP-binding protein [Kitasatospora sp. NPDC048194]|uniref:ATP-binding protein n=1 Tax=Kitasatospora sp. NPDC048194 TaxID=3364045 RepID=UPI00371A05AD
MSHALLEAHVPPCASSAPVASLVLPYEPESAGQARRFVRETLAAWGLAQLVDAAELITSELATNAVKTGCQRRMTVGVQLISPANVRITVRDGSCAAPVLIQASPDEECHRGLALVNLLTGGRWGVNLEPLGKVVYADLAVPAPVPR